MNIDELLRRYFPRIFGGGYGFDKLSYVLAIAGIVITAFGRGGRTLGIVLIGVSLWRAASKNKYKRYQELATFERMTSVFQINTNKFKRDFNEKRSFKVLTCPQCGQKQRVPRGKGKIIITCKKCRNEFKAKS